MFKLINKKIFTILRSKIVFIKTYDIFIQARYELALRLIEMPFKAFANRADPDHAALVRAA